MNPYTKTLVLVLILIEIFSVLPHKYPSSSEPSFPYLSGIIHVHSLFSDGGGTPVEIVDAAQKTGINFVILTDHNNTLARKESEGSHNGVDLYVEMEASTPGGHALAFSSLSEASTLSDQAIVDLSFKHFRGIETRNGLFIATAHPSNIKNPWNALDRYPDGMELINFDSLWQREVDDSVLSFLLTTFAYPLNPYLTGLRLFDVYAKDLNVWDAMTATPGRKFAILGHDTHAKLKINDQRWWRWPDYEETFRLASNIVILKSPPPSDFPERKKAVYNAIREGRNAIVFQSIAPFEGNDFRMECDKSMARSGDEIKNSKCLGIVNTPARFPYPVSLKIIRDSAILFDVHNAKSQFTFPVEKGGVYRVEVWAEPKSLFRIVLRRPVPYLFYNPIYVF